MSSSSIRKSRQKKSLWTVSLSVVLIGILSYTLFGVPSVRAAASVTLNAQSIGCDYISVTFTVSGTIPEDIAHVTAYSGSRVVGSTTGGGAAGTHTEVVPISPVQPANTPLYTVVRIGGASAQGSPTPCSGGTSPNPPATARWPGYFDGRLNPASDEYYSVWCQNDLINVYRAVPQVQLIQQIPFSRVLALDVFNRTFDAGGGLILSRNNDYVYIEGNNGNGAPAHDGKSFSLSDCIAHNGGAPSGSLPTRAPRVSVSSPTPTPTLTPKPLPQPSATPASVVRIRNWMT